MDAALDIRAKSASIGPGGHSSADVRAHVVGLGVFTLRWNERVRIVVPPGDHWVAVWARLVRKRHQGLSHATLHVEEGRVVAVQWQAPFTLFGSGEIALLPFGPAAGPAAQAADRPPRGLGPCNLTVAPGFGARALESGEALRDTASPAGAWHPDPTGRGPQRWWDGTRWTDAVSDGTATASDPIPDL